MWAKDAMLDDPQGGGQVASAWLPVDVGQPYASLLPDKAEPGLPFRPPWTDSIWLCTSMALGLRCWLLSNVGRAKNTYSDAHAACN